MRRLRSYFLAGVLSLLPVIVTIYVFWTAFQALDNLTSRLVEVWLGYSVPGVGFLLSVILVTLVGVVTTNVVGRHLVAFGERIVQKIPMANTIYSSVKQLIDTFTVSKRGAFSRVVLVQYPRQGVYSIGFVSNDANDEIQSKTEKDMMFVFVPTAPNPTSGFLILFPKEECIDLDLNVEEAFKTILSGGLLLPTETSDKNNGDAPNDGTASKSLK